MIRVAITAVALALLAAACAEQPAAPAGPVARYTSRGADGDVRFTPLAIALDVDGPVAGYQLELVVESGEATIVGVEGGEAPGFEDAPYYDPAALAGGRIVIGALSTEHVLPRGRQRVAVVHMREAGPAPVEYELRLMAAANASGERTAAHPVLVPAGKGASR